VAVERDGQEIGSGPRLLPRLIGAVSACLQYSGDELSEDEATRVLLVTYLLTGEKVHLATPRLTSLQDWPWEGPDGIHVKGRRYASRLCLRDLGEYDQWVALARGAWAKVGPIATGDEAGAGDAEMSTGADGGKALTAADKLKKELEKCIKAAQDHAFSLVDMGKAPVLLPRPLRADLARRLGVHRSTVGRLLRDDRKLAAMYQKLCDLLAVMGKTPERRREQTTCPSCHEPHDFRCHEDECPDRHDSRCRECHAEKVHNDIAVTESYAHDRPRRAE